MYVHGCLLDYSGGETSRQFDVDDCPQLDYPTRMVDFPAGTVTSLAAGQEHALAIVGGKLYGYGSNKVNQLHPSFSQAGLVHGVNSFTLIPQIPGTAASPPVQVACGFKHSIVRCVDGSLYACGDNTFSQLGVTGRGSKDASCAWKRVALDEPVSKIFAGANYSFAISGGNVWSWGQQQYGCLGHGTRGEMERVKSGCADQFKDVTTPKMITWFAQQRVSVVDLGIGRYHTVAMSATDVYTFGEGSYHKLGNNSTEDELVPRRVLFPLTQNLEKLHSVGAADETTIVLKVSPLLGAIIYLIGKDYVGEVEYTRPQRMLLPERVDDVRELVYGLGHFYIVAGGITQQQQQQQQQNQQQHQNNNNNNKQQEAEINPCTVWVYGKAGGGVPGGVTSLGMTGPDRDQRGIKSVSTMKGLHVSKMIELRACTFWLCDDSKKDPQRPSLEVMVDKDNRHPILLRRILRRLKREGQTEYKGEFKRADPDFYENNVKAYYYVAFNGDEEKIASRFAQLPVPAAETKWEDVYTRVGASCLKPGSHVRVWMQDVYALATIVQRGDAVGMDKNVFEVNWVREDWEPEHIELHSDDEVLDETNENRWQKLWYPTFSEEI